MGKTCNPVLKFKPWLLGPYDRCMDRIIESNHKNLIYCNKAEYHGIYQIVDE